MRSMSRILTACLLLILAAFAASAQTETFDLPPGTVGVPYTLNFGEGFEGLTSIPGFEFSYSFTVAGGTPPPGLTLRSNGLFSGTPTAAGNFNFTIRFTFVFRIEGVPAQPFTFDEGYRMQVTGGTGPAVIVEPAGLVFALTQGRAESRVLSVQNRSGVPRTFTATVTASGGNWLAASPAGGSVDPFGNGTVTVSASPGTLGPGTYSGRVTIAVTGVDQVVIPVTMSVSGGQQAIQLSQAGMTFRGVQGVPAQQSQVFNVINTGGGTLNWTATASTLSGGANWLTLTGASGRSDAASSPPVSVVVNPAGLAAGDYYGRVQVAAQGVANSPQTVSVVLSVAPATPAADPLVLPTGLIFVGQVGGTSPAVQNVRVTNIGSGALNFNTARSFENGSNWFSTTSLSGTIAPAATVNVPVQVSLTGITQPGVFRGELSIRFAENQALRRIAVLLIVVPRPPTASKENFADGCTPKTLIPVFTQLGSGFRIVAAWPSPLEVRVVDDCGTNITTGTVVATFSNSDPPLPLVSLQDGRWTGTWTARGSAEQVTITVRAKTTVPPLEGTSGIGGGADANRSTPLISNGGVISAASFAKNAPVAPGSFVAIFGERIGQGFTVSPGLPFSTELAGTEVIVGGKSMPLYFAADGQINAVVPYDIPANTQQQMVVRRGTAFSVPEPVTIAASQPAIFTQNNQGTGYGAILGVKADGTQFIVDANNRVSAGDVLVIYCAGLGTVDQPVAAGTAAPSTEPLARTVNPVTVKVGGKDATVLFSGLAPTYAGLYQINAVVPTGIEPAAEVALTVTVDGQASPPVNIAVQ